MRTIEVQSTEFNTDKEAKPTLSWWRLGWERGLKGAAIDLAIHDALYLSSAFVANRGSAVVMLPQGEVIHTSEASTRITSSRQLESPIMSSTSPPDSTSVVAATVDTYQCRVDVAESKMRTGVYPDPKFR